MLAAAAGWVSSWQPQPPGSVVRKPSVAAAAGWSVHITAHTVGAARTVAVARMPEHVHEPYTRDDDAFLWANRERPVEEVAGELGRGAKSCSARLEKLRSPTTEGHRRLFGEDENEEEGKAAALRPAHECIQRIIHDPGLTAADFVVGYRDRFQPGLLRAPFEAPNQSVNGAARMLVLALPEHRIEALWYRKRLVWHKASRRDDIFGSRGLQPDGSGLKIQQVITEYDEWAAAEKVKLLRARRRAVSALGGEPSFAALRELLGQVKDGALPPAGFVQAALSDDFFGADGNGDPADPNVADELRADTAGAAVEAEAQAEAGADAALAGAETVVQELVRTLPDAQVELRDELLEALSDRLERRTSSTLKPAGEGEEEEDMDAEVADTAALPVSTKKKKKKKQKKTGRQVAEGR